ncbi:hypothetical protein K883_05340 [Mycobacterium sp. TKK-01-0059]|uniref:type VII secretion target n=1 Tax=Mycobacterium sp. TKK-01-0059 TaxID=1324269 RepID=UPI0004D60471|nr:type VII secretion target [Mycobacterium sp. TKK-01-0059]KEF94916.1 hypothetical protein K883_05340 [Mycobacterium sp. TKK-01-0059]
MAELDVNPADLVRFAGAYSELAQRAAQISPQAVDEVQKVIDTHGPMGYPTAVGIAAGLAKAEVPVQAKVADFNTYAQRLTEHADTYTRVDGQDAQRVKALDFSTDLPGTGQGKDSPATPLDSKDSKAWKPGDKRHMPYIAGKGGKGPPNTADAPPWVDIYDRTQDPDQVPHSFVRSDEIPGVKVLPPNQLGPAPFYDEHGNEIQYVELSPKSGVWVPQSDFPGAKMYSPGVTPNPLPPYGYDEWLPGSGIYLWHGDMVPEPYNPHSMLPGQTTPQ